jgi:hypothetical protein
LIEIGLCGDEGFYLSPILVSKDGMGLHIKIKIFLDDDIFGFMHRYIS